MIEKTMSRTLMAGNVIATILVIAIHYNSKAFIETTTAFNLSYLIQDFIVNGLSRVAVPFFAMLSGFFLWGKINQKNSYIEILKPRIKSQFLPYISASLIIFVTYNLLTFFLKNEDFQAITYSSFLYDVVAHPKSPQLWFLRDLILLVCLSPILLNKYKVCSYVLLPALFLLWLFNLQLLPIFAGYYIINIETLFFFCFGGFIFKNQRLLTLVINSQPYIKISIMLLWLSLIFLRMYLKPDLDVWYVEHYSLVSLIVYKIGIVVGIIALIAGCRYLAENKVIITLSGLTFFVFLFHLVPLSYFRVLTDRFISKDMAFFINFPLATITIFLTAYVVAKTQPKIFAFLTGGRNPEKALKRTTAVEHQ